MKHEPGGQSPTVHPLDLFGTLSPNSSGSIFTSHCDNLCNVMERWIELINTTWSEGKSYLDEMIYSHDLCGPCNETGTRSCYSLGCRMLWKLV